MPPETIQPNESSLPIAPKFFALTDDLTHDQLVQFLMRLWVSGHMMTFAGLKAYRRELGLP